MFGQILTFGLVAVAALLYSLSNQRASVTLLTSARNYERDVWFGHGQAPADFANDTTVHPFHIHVPDEVLVDLGERLSRTRSFVPLDGIGWKHGADTTFMAEIVEYWQNSYDWRQQEAILNRYEHFHTRIDGLNIHFVHIKANRTKHSQVYPALLVHGWPGSFFEFWKVIDGFVDPVQGIAFDVVVPSLPGFSFSEAPGVEGVSTLEDAVILHKLMLRLGYDRFFYQGGDWGGVIGAVMAMTYPQSLGFHLNFFPGLGSPILAPIRLILGEFIPSYILPNKLERNFHFPFFTDKLGRLLQETGYMYLQATYPSTIAHALSDSPAGLAAWIIEKFQFWSDCHDNVLNSFSRDELLTNVMLYWVTSSAASSLRIYRESLQRKEFMIPMIRNGVSAPVGLLAAVSPDGYPMENMPRKWAEYKFHNIVSYSYATQSGHFVAMENPSLLVEDFRKFVTLTVSQQIRNNT